MDEQLNAVMQEFKVEVDPDSLLGRCVACNARDWIVTTDKDMVKHEVDSDSPIGAQYHHHHSRFNL